MAHEAVKTVYHLAYARDWAAAQARGAYAGTADDARDGFVHASTAAQVAASAAQHRAGRDDVVLLWLDVAALGTSLRWEPSRGGGLFPHVYGAVPLSAVRRVEPLPRTVEGWHRFPPLDGAPVLLVPGLGGSGPEHWQTRWAQRFGWGWLEQADWHRPVRDEWVDALERAVRAAERPPLLVAHSLGCALVAHWARRPGAARVPGALLVAPADVDCERRTPAEVRGFSPMPLERLPFPAVVIASRSDPYVDFARASRLAARWGARLVDAGERGHLNADSRLGDWPQGRAELDRMLAAVDG